MSQLSDNRAPLDFKKDFIDHVRARERFLARAEITIEQSKLHLEREKAFWARLTWRTDEMTAIVEEMEASVKRAKPGNPKVPADASLPSLVERLEAAVKALEAKS